MSKLALALVAGALFVAYRAGADAAIEEVSARVEELSWWDKLLIGIGWTDPEDVLDPSAVNGVGVGRRSRCTTC